MKSTIENKMIQNAVIINTIIIIISHIVPKMIWITLAKSDNNFLYITFAMLTLIIPSTAGGLIYAGHFEYKIFRFISSFIIAGLTYILWNKIDAQIIPILVQENMITRLYIKFILKVVFLGLFFFAVFEILFLKSVHFLKMLKNKIS